VNICEYLFIMNVKCRAAMGLVSFSPTEEVSECGVRISGWVKGSDIEVVFFVDVEVSLRCVQTQGYETNVITVIFFLSFCLYSYWVY